MLSRRLHIRDVAKKVTCGDSVHRDALELDNDRSCLVWFNWRIVTYTALKSTTIEITALFFKKKKSRKHNLVNIIERSLLMKR